MAGSYPIAPGFRRKHFETVASTNTTALELARAGEADRLWVTADRQTGGRGRRGRYWFSEPGNLYSSLYLADPAPAERLGELPLVAAVSLARAIEAACDAAGKVALKWPNDLLIEGKKLSGILAEAHPLPDGRRAVLIGIGVNVGHHPDIPDYATTSLAALGWTDDVEKVFAFLAAEMAEQLAIWNAGRGFAMIRDAWLVRAAALGKTIEVKQGDTVRRGRFVTLDGEGRLVLDDESGNRVTVSAGDVFFSS
ncbi:MAG: biotin--[acetyl-CoA-carboxylase] ligase [Hyphomicrobiales bacterium]|nr:MAG: biotin--[acetyl-CoA-carboxylase] ligase [Hyphomicrobiales bacterium]